MIEIVFYMVDLNALLSDWLTFNNLDKNVTL